MDKFEKEDAFWEHIAALSKLNKAQGDVVVPTERYEELYHLIDDLYSTYEAGNFVKMIGILQSGTYRAVAKGLLDLKNDQWDIDKFTKRNTGRISSYQQYQGGWSDRALITVWRYNAEGLNKARQEFLDEYRALLLPVQRDVLFSPQAKVA
jgi:hypothetical protein